MLAEILWYQAHFTNRPVCFPQHLTAFMEAILDKVGVRCLPNIFAEQLTAFAPAYNTGGCNIIKSYLKVVIPMNVLGHLTDSHPCLLIGAGDGNMLYMPVSMIPINLLYFHMLKKNHCKKGGIIYDFSHYILNWEGVTFMVCLNFLRKLEGFKYPICILISSIDKFEFFNKSLAFSSRRFQT